MNADKYLLAAGKLTPHFSAGCRLTDLGPIFLVTTPDRGVIYEAAVDYGDRLGMETARITYRAAIAACARYGRN